MGWNEGAVAFKVVPLVRMEEPVRVDVAIGGMLRSLGLLINEWLGRWWVGKLGKV